MSEDDSLEEMSLLGKKLKDKATTYRFLGTQDRHLIDIIHWVDIIEKLKAEVAEGEMDNELVADLEKIIARLTREVGVRMLNIFP